MTQNFKIAFLSLIISFTILFTISSFLAINIIENNPKKIEKTNLTNKIEYKIPKNQDLTILLVISNEREENIENKNFKEKYYVNQIKKNEEKLKDLFILFKISAYSNKIALLNLPENFKTISQTNDGYIIGKGSLQMIYHYEGIENLKNAIENATNVDINNTIELTYNETFNLTNYLGGIKNNENDIIAKKENFQKNLSQNPIKTLLLLKNNFDEKTNLNKFFAFFSNIASTDISIKDFKNRKKGFEIMLEKHNTKVIIPHILIENLADINKISEQSKKEIAPAFK